MPLRFHALICIGCLVALAAARAETADVYKCTTADGAIAFQDAPCAAGQTETTIHLTQSPPLVAAPAPASSEGGEVPADSSRPPPARIVQGGNLPELWNCIRAEDGAPFISQDGPTPPRMVPLGILGGPSKSLASAYGPGGIGVSAPGMRKTPIDTSAQDAVASDYVAVQDHCEPATKEQVCIYLQQQYNDVEKKLQRAFKDQQEVLKPQESKLLRQLGGC